MKEDEKKPLSWEAADPKPPVIHSGRMENRTRNEKADWLNAAGRYRGTFLL